jgi:glycosyltransferase involved in cell wall biosynthesis
MPKRKAVTRVLVVSHTHPRLTQGGGEIAAFETFRRLDASPDHEGWLLSHDAGMLPERAGAPFTQPFGPREYLYAGRSFDHLHYANPDPNFAPAFEALLLRLQPDVVHFHHFLGIGLEALAIARRVLPEVRVVLTLHEYLLLCHHHGQMVTRPELALCEAPDMRACHRCFPEHSQQAFYMRELFIRRFLEEVDRFVSPSHFLRERFLAWGLPPERFTVMENPLTPMAVESRETRRGDGPVLIGFFGQVSELKGLGVLFAAARLLEERGWKGLIEVHGVSYPQPELLQVRLDRIMAAIPGNVVMQGPYRNAHVGRLMQACDAVVVPSIWWENSPVVVREAEAAGVAVIGADLGGVGEKVAALPQGILFRARDSVALAEAIASIRQPQNAPGPAARRRASDIPPAMLPAPDPLQLYRGVIDTARA